MTYRYLQNVGTGEVHRLLVDEAGRGRPLEQCNTDAIVHQVWISEAVALSLPVERRCGHCWPGPR